MIRIRLGLKFLNSDKGQTCRLEEHAGPSYQMFLGTFVGAALSPAAQAAGKFVPAFYVTDALTSLFSRGAPASSPTVIFDLAFVSICSAVVLLLGIVLFKKYGKA